MPLHTAENQLQKTRKLSLPILPPPFYIYIYARDKAFMCKSMSQRVVLGKGTFYTVTSKIKCIIGVISMARSKSILLGLLVGTVVGGAATLLTSPSSGKQVRQQIRNNKEKMTDSVNQMKSEIRVLKQTITNASKDSADVLKEVSAELKQSVQEWQVDIEPNKEDLQKELSEIEDKIKELETTVKQ
ncbi:hypothetical protein GJU40_04630 [Bacillus lacus]|uniref:YtxH domain-containing protein n=2 Tax=Metabacillus lacus TaxID=1983721 RepID=A0A7X2IXF5_9BACI|nr:hypothetical protein [Metabacillus lacus]